MTANEANQTEQSFITSLLAMRPAEVHRFVRESVKDRQLGKVVRDLNVTALSDKTPDAQNASKALKKLGFTD